MTALATAAELRVKDFFDHSSRKVDDFRSHISKSKTPLNFFTLNVY